ncbi:MAG TPA: hypothetical protein PL190_00030 [Caldisericia bacterium]|jgi:hypothetical protein|nr:hypothetical protein [Caldisericia bacterium]NMD14549.1 hypothetical protein [Caldisericales bacterium]HNW31828.1 hypothetical protein [Caldisericia bacterium]HNY60730.1 hypothetical protein [Caldisericia bacterium]HOC79432.1 hypothetical protein [Caldisericia bacterium]
MNKRMVFGIQVTNRAKNAGQVQKILTDYGCNIRTRIGLHEVDDKVCSPSGLILLELYGKEQDILKMEETLKAIDGVIVQKMVFEC